MKKTWPEDPHRFSLDRQDYGQGRGGRLRDRRVGRRRRSWRRRGRRAQQRSSGRWRQCRPRYRRRRRRRLWRRRSQRSHGNSALANRIARQAGSDQAASTEPKQARRRKRKPSWTGSDQVYVLTLIGMPGSTLGAAAGRQESGACSTSTTLTVAGKPPLKAVDVQISGGRGTANGEFPVPQNHARSPPTTRKWNSPASSTRPPSNTSSS